MARSTSQFELHWFLVMNPGLIIVDTIHLPLELWHSSIIPRFPDMFGYKTYFLLKNPVKHRMQDAYIVEYCSIITFGFLYRMS